MQDKPRIRDVLDYPGFCPTFCIYLQDHSKGPEIVVCVQFGRLNGQKTFHVRNVYGKTRMDSTTMVDLRHWPPELTKPPRVIIAEKMISRLTRSRPSHVGIDTELHLEQDLLSFKCDQKFLPFNFGIQQNQLRHIKTLAWDNHVQYRFTHQDLWYLWLWWVMRNAPQHMQRIWPELYSAIPHELFVMIADFMPNTLSMVLYVNDVALIHA